ncbi:uncharacterized protein LOC120487658 [Pimephales promelas]|uniref:uncharacterized protein LOC120487658 n=1 Tax=Pimephales promelas TaxID=90988 RepID=UPI001955E12A|nr:uncharacterized protein LOC120487658 [Pimephales promelas]
MATSKEGISLPVSPVRPKRAVQRPRYLDDFLVEYTDQHSLAQMHRHEEERNLLSPARSISSMTPMQNANDAIVHQALETARQQSETAKKQTELLEFFLQHHSLQTSAQWSRRSSRHQTPVRKLYPDRGGEPQPSPALAPHHHRTEDHPSETAEISHQLEQMTLPPPLSRVIQPPKHTLNPCHDIQSIKQDTEYDPPAHLQPSHPKGSPQGLQHSVGFLRNVSSDSSLLSYPISSNCKLNAATTSSQHKESGESQLGNPHRVPLEPHNYLPHVAPPRSLHVSPATDQMMPLPMHQSTFQPPYVPQPFYQGNPAMLAHYPSTGYQHPPLNIEGPTFPDFTQEDRAQYVELRLSLSTLLHPSQSEHYKYAILLKHVKVPQAHRLVLAHAESNMPYSEALKALDERYGRPYQFVLKEIEDMERLPPIRSDRALDEFSIRVQSLVGMLKALRGEGHEELHCGSNVKRLLSRLPKHQQERFRRQQYRKDPDKLKLTLTDFSEWLKAEVRCLDIEPSLQAHSEKDRREYKQQKSNVKITTVMHGTGSSSNHPSNTPSKVAHSIRTQVKGKIYCPYCEAEHYLSQCESFAKLTKAEMVDWIKVKRRCWRCGRSHLASACDLKKPCRLCKSKHLSVLHEVNQRSENEPTIMSTAETHYLDQPNRYSQVLLKIVRVNLQYQDKVLDTYAVLDDGSERTILLSSAARRLGVQGQAEDLTLRTIRQDIKILSGSRVSFTITPASQPTKRFSIQGAFTGEHLGLSQYSYPVTQLQRRYRHLRGLTIPPIDGAQPTLLIGSDNADLIVPIEPVHLGPPGGPAAVKTKLGWTLQGPAKYLQQQLPTTQCLFTTVSSPSVELFSQVERLWQLDTLPFKSERLVTRSRQDKYSVDLLEAETIRVEVNGVHRYATPLLRVPNMPKLKVSKEVVMKNLRNTEKRLVQDPLRASTYREEIKKLEIAGYVNKIDSCEADSSEESWFLPHHMVRHNGKERIVFNCSFQLGRQSLNNYLLPGPALGPSLLGVLLRFREHRVAVSGDIKGMFHQIRLLDRDKPLLRFLWRDLKTDEQPSVYQWEVLPFGTTCSPCCAIFALQKHVNESSQPGENVRHSVEQCFYVDNCLQSLPTVVEASNLVTRLRNLLAAGGFEIRQWASNQPEVICNLPKEAKSDSSERWVSEMHGEAQEMTLGLSWHFMEDTLHYRHRPVAPSQTTMRHIYKILASQYDPLGHILPFTTRAKVLVQRLWAKDRDWDDSNLPVDLLQAWTTWEEELPQLPKISLSRSYFPLDVDVSAITLELHVFCDASESAYGSVAYLRGEDPQGQVHVAFVLARSRVAPKKQQSMPRLELCAALTGAQLAQMIQRELTLQLRDTVLWSDSTTVLAWIKSESCRYKVFVGTRISEIQELTDHRAWRYVDTQNNPADPITRGMTLSNLAKPNQFSQGPAFLRLPRESWPATNSFVEVPDETEMKRSAFCGFMSAITAPEIPAPEDHSTFEDLLEATSKSLHGAAFQSSALSADDYGEAELRILQRAQYDSFPDEVKCLKAGKALPSSSRLLSLAPEYDVSMGLIRVGGRLRRSTSLEEDVVHPIVLEPKHHITKLIIRQYDNQLLHPGSERVFAELRRKFWILQGREAVRRHQRSCPECQKWRAKPVIPKMADLPPCRLRLLKPPFYSTGVDCFGPFQVKRGRSTEKRWGIVFKCMTTRCVHLDVLSNMDTDSFLMSLRRFVARRGTPFELLSDCGTNFRGGEHELKASFEAMGEELQIKLAKQQIRFQFNPPNAPHFGGAWEREVRSIKAALYVTLGAQTVTEEVLQTVLIEVEGILNSKPLGYVSTDVADADPVTPNYLLMGRPDSSLPQVVYPESEILSRRRWRHSQVLADQFWTHFIRSYLPFLQSRQKWVKDTENLTVGTVVMVIDQRLPRALWPVGRVTKTIRSVDGKVRTAEVQVEERTYTRPVAKLIELPAIPDNVSTTAPVDS